MLGSIPELTQLVVSASPSQTASTSLVFADLPQGEPDGLDYNGIPAEKTRSVRPEKNLGVQKKPSGQAIREAG
jgi:hypothetical protein